jgi:uncharacterized membrane protein YbjE (DUF340 family)
LLADIISAGVIAVSAACGSVLISLIFIGAIRSFSKASVSCPPELPSAVHPKRHVWRPVFRSLGFLIVGIFASRWMPVLAVETPIRAFLLLMIVCVGLQSAEELRTLSMDRVKDRSATGASLVLFFGLPVAVIAGTLLFSAVAGLFLRYGWRESMLCAAPLGWQTLGGPMVQELRGVRLGNVAFLANMFRDVVALVMIPLVSRGRYLLLGVTPGGVSSMDILLPGIMAASGLQSLMYAMWVGASCSFWAPILIYLIAKVGG